MEIATKGFFSSFNLDILFDMCICFINLFECLSDQIVVVIKISYFLSFEYNEMRAHSS